MFQKTGNVSQEILQENAGGFHRFIKFHNYRSKIHTGFKKLWLFQLQTEFCDPVLPEGGSSQLLCQPGSNFLEWDLLQPQMGADLCL